MGKEVPGELTLKRINPYLWTGAWGLSHLLVDAVSVSVALLASRQFSLSPLWAIGIVLLYDVLAFALQPLIGLGLDFKLSIRLVSSLGCLLVLSGVAIAAHPIPAVLLCGLGNAAFHAGGGAGSLRLQPGRAMWPVFAIGR